MLSYTDIFTERRMCEHSEIQIIHKLDPLIASYLTCRHILENKRKKSLIYYVKKKTVNSHKMLTHWHSLIPLGLLPILVVLLTFMSVNITE
jgi:hypothetical protein